MAIKTDLGPMQLINIAKKAKAQADAGKVISPATVKNAIENATGIETSPLIQRTQPVRRPGSQPTRQGRPQEEVTFDQATGFGISQQTEPIYKKPLFWAAVAGGGFILYKLAKK